MEEQIIYGRNPVEESLKEGLDRLYIQKGQKEGSIRKIISQARQAGIPIFERDKARLDDLAQGGKHQGVVAIRTSFKYVTIEDILAYAQERKEAPLILFLDGIEDPQNLGAIARSALALGAHGLVIPKHRAARVNGRVFKASAGAIDHLRVAMVTNMSQEVLALKDRGLWFYGAHMEGDSLYETRLEGPMGLVIGSEGQGISKKLRDHMDFLISIPMAGAFDSLNASVAAGILLYERARQGHGS
ncbi:MAG: 23S rRNA (guanosine(2251)-2'-O)-methyltransferase RlmB [Tissierellia bacterium]|nr:23S rRNA (guanosine(2251)-2'-O)-methyltransferase RlmB [Tissierellia bacterium]